MHQPLDSYWQLRLQGVKAALEMNNFDVYPAVSVVDAKRIVLEEILPRTAAKSVSWGGSMTFMATGLYDYFRNHSGITVLDTFEKNLPLEEIVERRRQALLTDLFIMGTNAVTESGQLVNLDMNGNRVAALTFGPKFVVVLVGRNKIVPDIESAMFRIKNYAAPANAIRLDKKTPCVKTSYCEECHSPDRICNYWTVTEKSYPKQRIKVVLINEDLGL